MDPLGAFTPEAKAALQEAKSARQRSIILRSGLKDALNNAARTQTAAHKTVNDGLTQKMSETVQLKVCWITARIINSRFASVRGRSK